MLILAFYRLEVRGPKYPSFPFRPREDLHRVFPLITSFSKSSGAIPNIRNTAPIDRITTAMLATGVSAAVFRRHRRRRGGGFLRILGIAVVGMRMEMMDGFDGVSTRVSRSFVTDFQTTFAP